MRSTSWTRRTPTSRTPTVTVTFQLLSAEALAATLRKVSRFGISDAFPPETDFTSDAAKRALAVARAPHLPAGCAMQSRRTASSIALPRT